MKKTLSLNILDYILLIGTSLSIFYYFVATKFLSFSSIDNAVVSIGIQIIALLIQGIRSKQTVEDMKDDISELSNRPDLRIFGSRGDLEIEDIIKTKKARYIRNTFIDVMDNRSDGEQGAFVKELYQAWFGNKIDGVWEDIAGPSERSDDRFTTWKFDSRGNKKKHVVYFLKEASPVLNFCIFEYPDKTREVAFGWLTNMNRKELLETKIFISNDEELINVFEALFNRMKSTSENGFLGTNIVH